MGRLFFLSTGVLLLLGLVQFIQCADINGSSIVKASGGDLPDEASAIVANALVSGDQEKLAAFFPDAKSRFFKSLNNMGDKRNPSIYSFGLGKRSSGSNVLNPYSFGLGKRSSSASNYPQQNPYSFGLGKRTPGIYSFGLGKRAYDREDEVWKRNSNRFGFGLGKRNSLDDDSDQWLTDDEYLQQTEDDSDDEEQEEVEAGDSQEIIDVNKRTPSIQTGRAFFPSHLRSAFFGSGQLPSSITMNRRPASSGAVKTHTLHQSQQSNDMPNLGKRLPVYNFGLGK